MDREPEKGDCPHLPERPGGCFAQGLSLFLRRGGLYHFSPAKLELPPGRVPWILKGVWEHGSRDMGDEAVLRDASPAEVRQRLDRRAARSGRPCFAEQFIDGREFAVTVLARPQSHEPEVLLPAEIDFSAFPAGKPRIVGYSAKWCDDQFEYHHTPRRFDYDPSDGPLLDELRRLAGRCWECFGLRGWVRVDFRVDHSGQPWILEVNANPCLSPDAGFAAALQQCSIPYDQAIARILEDCDNIKT